MELAFTGPVPVGDLRVTRVPQVGGVERCFVDIGRGGITLALECDKKVPQDTLGLFCDPENDVWTYESGDFRRPHYVMFGGLHNAYIIYCLSPLSLVFQVPAPYSRATFVEEMGLKGCETCCQVSCEGSVSRGLPYRIPGLFEIFFILLFPGRARRGRLKKKVIRKSGCFLVVWIISFRKVTQTVGKIRSGARSPKSWLLPCCWWVALRGRGSGCFKRRKIGGWCRYVAIFVEPS